MKTLNAHTIAADSAYKAFSADKRVFSAFTIAAFAAAGAIKLNKTSVSRKGGKDQELNVDLFRAITKKPTARAYWIKTGRLDPVTGLTAEGINEINARLAGQTRGLNTEMALVQTIHAAITKGGEIKLNGEKFSFDSPVSVTA